MPAFSSLYFSQKFRICVYHSYIFITVYRQIGKPFYISWRFQLGKLCGHFNPTQLLSNKHNFVILNLLYTLMITLNKFYLKRLESHDFHETKTENPRSLLNVVLPGSVLVAWLKFKIWYFNQEKTKTRSAYHLKSFQVVPFILLGRKIIILFVWHNG